MTSRHPLTVQQQSVEPFADEFGVGEGLEVSIKWISRESLVVAARLNGNVFESYAATSVETALSTAGYLIRGSQPPRDLICPGTPVR